MYGLITYIRNKMFDFGVLKTSKHKTAVVSIGNLKAGGTGKTPTVEYLLRSLSSDYSIAVVSRGYGRKTQGYRQVNPQGSASEYGDEPLQMARKFPNVFFAVCEDRNKAIETIERTKPEVNLILLDDAYQHRYVERDVNILLTEYGRPFFKDRTIPWGLLREYRRGYLRADCIVVTKCPNLSPKEKEEFVRRLKPKNYQSVFFSQIRYPQAYRLGKREQKADLTNRNVFLLTAIANNRPLIAYLKTIANLIGVKAFADHHNFTAKELGETAKEFSKTAFEKNETANTETLLLTTEKDACRIENFPQEIYVQPIETTLQPYTLEQQSIETIIQNAICTKK